MGFGRARLNPESNIRIRSGDIRPGPDQAECDRIQPNIRPDIRAASVYSTKAEYYPRHRYGADRICGLGCEYIGSQTEYGRISGASPNIAFLAATRAVATCAIIAAVGSVRVSHALFE